MVDGNEKHQACPNCGNGFIATDGEDDDAWLKCDGCGWSGPYYLTYRISPNMFDIFESALISLVGKTNPVVVKQGGWRIVGKMKEQNGVHFYVHDECGGQAHITPWTVDGMAMDIDGTVYITLQE